MMKNTAEIRPGMCVGVMGLGVTGQAAVRYCLSRGATVLASDSRTAEDWPQELTSLVAQHGVAWEAGGHSSAFLKNAESVIVSPGISLDHPVIRQLQEAGIPLLGELAVAAPWLTMPVIAVTGTNGKTTVTSLIGEIVREAGKKVFVGGNIGIPIFDYLLRAEPAEVVVLEVSSFQLLLAGTFAPQVGVLLNITPDHFDRHGTLSEYAEAKMTLFAHQRPDQAAVICADDPECLSRKNRITAEGLTFGTSSGCSAHIEGLTVEMTVGTETFRYDLAGTALANGIGVSNAAAAILACRAIGIEPAVIQSALRKFQPGPHRIEFVGELQGGPLCQ